MNDENKPVFVDRDLVPLLEEPHDFVQRANRGVIVVYWKDCGHCKESQKKGVVFHFARSLQHPNHALGDVQVYEVDLDTLRSWVEGRKFYDKNNLRGFPSLVLEDEGQEPMVVKGFDPEEALRIAVEYFQKGQKLRAQNPNGNSNTANMLSDAARLGGVAIDEGLRELPGALNVRTMDETVSGNGLGEDDVEDAMDLEGGKKKSRKHHHHRRTSSKSRRSPSKSRKSKTKSKMAGGESEGAAAASLAPISAGAAEEVAEPSGGVAGGKRGRASSRGRKSPSRASSKSRRHHKRHHKHIAGGAKAEESDSDSDSGSGSDSDSADSASDDMEGGAAGVGAEGGADLEGGSKKRCPRGMKKSKTSGTCVPKRGSHAAASGVKPKRALSEYNKFTMAFAKERPGENLMKRAAAAWKARRA